MRAGVVAGCLFILGCGPVGAPGMEMYEPLWEAPSFDPAAGMIAIDALAEGVLASSCGWDVPADPQGTVFADPLLGLGADTLRAGEHDHDDGFGAVGLCRAEPVEGAPYFRLVAAGFESDEDLDGSGAIGDSALSLDFWRDDAPRAVGESGGRRNIYVDVVDENGATLNADNAPELQIVRRTLGGASELYPVAAKVDEFDTRLPMLGGERISVSIEGVSDEVLNLRAPAEHNVSYVLVFQRLSPGH